LLTRLTEARKAGDVGCADAYRALAQGICSEFRKLVERSVEEDLLNKVVLRLGREFRPTAGFEQSRVSSWRTAG
jgi:hypothetical protein